ncbi:NAD(P)-binding protein [Cucurbitaria berberidis CBS 394.84]|uniref:NAD(P)-binding protein n=1 Tax=Cucurbitaria berberidis CBS 394.84 TaxID=1168544 RepID=A0A9P4GFU9_9PLEO|nr:NAD(P)-binding protein [Cucurbitaria berberidis CBS 394.84]KAF1844464.1 NAD(P)-binding protein [Cucurbitaria berberidis CBS 394.84]
MSAAPEKQIILITGATNGIGLDSAIYLAAASPNNHVVIGARSLSKGEKVLKEVQAKNLSGTVSLVQLDANDDSSITAAAKKLKEDFGRLDVLINNAGVCPETAEDQWPSRENFRSIFETNVFGPTILTETLIPLLKASKSPKIINVSSSLGSIAAISDHSGSFSAVPYPAYRMSKAALNMLTAYQYYHLEQFGVKVWSYCPGYVVTDLGRDREQREKMGMESSETSAQGIVEIVEGKRDAEVGTFIARRGEQYQW